MRNLLGALPALFIACVPVPQSSNDDPVDSAVGARDARPPRMLSDLGVGGADVAMMQADGAVGDATVPDAAADSGLTDEPCFAGGERRPCAEPECAGGFQQCVEGLWSLCRYPDEACDGVDNDCDGAADEGLGLGEACTAGTGACAADGETACGPEGEVVCDAQTSRPSSERCDEIDNDCDGETDEGLGLDDACTSGLGACEVAGLQVCDGEGGVTCDAVPREPAEAELCDEVDNDCDGAVDEALALGERCTVGLGACLEVGINGCGDDGVVSCSAVPGAPGAETCDGTDEDCDGEVDEDFQVGEVCEVGAADCVAQGRIQCVDGGRAECDARPGAPEVCDGLDNDCDGDSDEDFDVGAACVVGGGVCRADGEITCDEAGGAFCDAVVPFEIDLGDGSDGALVVNGEVALEAGRRYQHTDVTVANGGVLTVAAWDGEAGGAVDLLVSGRFHVEVGGVVDVTGRGHQGGAPNPKLNMVYPNEWTNGGGSTGYHGGGPGGGGGGWAAPQGTVGAGGGGGFGVAGVAGRLCGADARANYSVWDVNDGVARPIPNPLPRFSSGGPVYSDALVDDLPLGSGGGSGGNNYDGGPNGVGGAGGHGGGAVRVVAGEVVVEGRILANGTAGTAGVGGNYVGGGGGGSGGTVHLVGLLVTNDGEIRAEGAAGAAGTGGSVGGAGAVGRIRVDAGERGGDGVFAPEVGHAGELACAPEDG